MADVVILGAGYAGIRAVKTLSKLAPKGTTLTVVDQNANHEERTQLHEVAAGTVPATKITFNIQQVLPKDVQFIQSKVSKVDVSSKLVVLENHAPLRYDYLIIALGFRSEDFGLPGAAENALPLDNVTSAETIAKTIEQRVANYKQSQDPKDLTVIVAGAGFTGVELLGELTHSLPALAQKYDTPPVKIISMEMATRILPMFDEKLANYAMDYLKSHGVTMMTGSKITKIEPNAVVYADGDQEKKVEGNTIIWTVGVSGSDVIADSGFNQRRNRVVVSNHLNLTDHPEVFIIGDVSAVMTDAGRPYPTTAQISSQEGDHAGKNVAAALNGQPLTDFVYKPKGTVASLGSQDGIAQIGKSHKYTGFIAKVLKRVITDKSLLEDANLSTMLKQGRWPL
ncbi:NAD(P)/FAD-dependent oxidoreductase [Lacticaseibacillus rhamnosus]|uniref:NAD(P)/FAD-dependent oxidoreductase n=1 Tax=Lacticaseibacillus rhamnosus TaxID=47715 RepID=A0A7Y7QFP8_LACRH|nr:NAD(P)/FAD-dependent oxidoreductase [Lacticaseibacillus rhamnosus]NVO88201.1 NAD(P)/FAD-dependent oxidoreductase [Lacticaseibacillus rhamnosus]